MSRSALALIAATILALASCSRVEPLEQKVMAPNTAAFQRWRGRETGSLNAVQRAQLDGAIQELKFSLMAGGATGGVLDEGLAGKVNGRTVREVMLLGYEAKLARLEEKWSSLFAFVAQNAALETKPGDTASAGYLAEKRAKQIAALKAINDEIAETRTRLAEAGLTLPAWEPRPLPPLVPPPTQGYVPPPGGKMLEVEERPDTPAAMQQRG